MCQADHSCWAVQERFPKDSTTRCLIWRNKGQRQEAERAPHGHVSTSKPGRGEGDGRCSICGWGTEITTREPTTHMLTTDSPAEQKYEPTTLLLGRHLVEIGKLKGNSLPPAGQGISSVHGRHLETRCPKEALLNSFFPHIQLAD